MRSQEIPMQILMHFMTKIFFFPILKSVLQKLGFFDQKFAEFICQNMKYFNHWIFFPPLITFPTLRCQKIQFPWLLFQQIRNLLSSHMWSNHLFQQSIHIHILRLPCSTNASLRPNEAAAADYRMRTIISCSLYIFTPFLKTMSLFSEIFFQKIQSFCTASIHERFVIKGGL